MKTSALLSRPSAFIGATFCRFLLNREYTFRIALSNESNIQQFFSELGIIDETGSNRSLLHLWQRLKRSQEDICPVFLAVQLYSHPHCLNRHLITLSRTVGPADTYRRMRLVMNATIRPQSRATIPLLRAVVVFI